MLTKFTPYDDRKTDSLIILDDEFLCYVQPKRAKLYQNCQNLSIIQLSNSTFGRPKPCLRRRQYSTFAHPQN
jgi:hypothetical protein